MTLSVDQLDGLKEVVNIGVARAAKILNAMLTSHIKLNVPEIKVITREELAVTAEAMPTEILSSVQLGFSGECAGSASLIFPSSSAGKLVAALTDDSADAEDMDSIRTGTLTEVGNIVVNAVMGQISNLLGHSLLYQVPLYLEEEAAQLISRHAEDTKVLLLANTFFNIEDHDLDGNIMIVFEAESFETLLKAIQNLV